MVVIVDILRKLGLNKYETKAYLALVKLGSASAFEISKKSTVPFGRIYDSLNVLEIKGFIKVVPSKPKKYIAVDPKAALNGLIDEQFDELTIIRKQVKDSISKLVKEDSSSDKVSINTGRVNLSKRVDQHFSYHDQLWATSEEFKLEKDHPAVHRYTKGQMKNEYLFVDSSKADVKRLKELGKQGLNFRHYPLHNVRFLVSDEELVTIAFKKGSEWVNIQVKNKALGKALTKLLKTAWSKSKII